MLLGIFHMKFIKTFEIDGYQVAAICRGISDKSDNYQFEQCTLIDDIHIRTTVEIPFETYEKVLEIYQEANAQAFLNLALAAVE